jgi:hypothetical protein
VNLIKFALSEFDVGLFAVNHLFNLAQSTAMQFAVLKEFSFGVTQGDHLEKLYSKELHDL